MTRLQFLSPNRSVAAALMLVVSSNLPSQLAQAQTPDAQSQPTPSIYYSPPTPPSRGTPEGRPQGGGRPGKDNQCEQYRSLKALVPLAKTGTQAFLWGQTAVDRPTFWFYAPAGLTAEVPVEFALRDQSGSTVYKTAVKTPETPGGVFRLSLPETAPKLQTDQLYSWTLSVFCSSGEVDRPLIMQGLIKRVDLSPQLQQQLAAAKTPVERAVIYAKHGIWYEGLTTLGVQRVAQPNDRVAAMAWADLLRQVNLKQPASTAIVPCCSPE